MKTAEQKARDADNMRKWRAANKERAREIDLACKARNAEKIRADKKARYARDREKNLAYAAEYRAKNAEAIKEKCAGKYSEWSAKYRAKNYEKCLGMTQAWKDANPERRAATNAAWSQNNLDKHRSYQHNRRGQKAACGGKLSPDLADRLLFLQKNKCACCGKSLSNGYEMDHIIPLSKGGRNIDSNIQLLTPSCNRSKGSTDPVEFMQKKRGMLL